MSRILVDSGAFYALNSPRDKHFEQAREILDQLREVKAKLITTDYIVDETATTLLATKKGGYKPAAQFLSWLLERNNPVEVVWIGKQQFYEAVKVFRRFNKDKSWSFTDCTSYVVMKELKIKQAFTFDEHFKQMGFELL